MLLGCWHSTPTPFDEEDPPPPHPFLGVEWRSCPKWKCYGLLGKPGTEARTLPHKKHGLAGFRGSFRKGRLNKATFGESQGRASPQKHGWSLTVYNSAFHCSILVLLSSLKQLEKMLWQPAAYQASCSPVAWVQQWARFWERHPQFALLCCYCQRGWQSWELTRQLSSSDSTRKTQMMPLARQRMPTLCPTTPHLLAPALRSLSWLWEAFEMGPSDLFRLKVERLVMVPEQALW